MAEGYEVAKAVVTLIPSMQGSQAIITKEITGASEAAGTAGGKQMGKSMSSGLSSSMSSVGKVIAGVTAGIGAVAGISAAIMESFQEVDAGLDTIATKTGASGAQLENMKTNMENLATSIPTSFEEAGEAIGEVNTRFGLSGKALEDLSGQFIKFAKLNDTDVTTSVDNVSKVISAFGMESKDAGNLLDALNKVGQDTDVDIKTLTTSLSQNAAQLQEMGLSAYDAAGFLGSCDMAGMEISTTMTGLKTAMKNATADGKNLDDFLSEFSSTMNSNATESEKLTAAYETFGTKAGGAIYNAVQNGKIDLEDLTNSLGEFEGSVNSTFEQVTDPTDEFAEVLNRMKIVGADIAEAVMPMLADALEGIAGAIDWFMDAITPTETALTNFIKDTNDAIKANQDAMDQTAASIDAITSTTAEMEYYKDVLIELNDKAALNEFEQYQLKDAVDKLSASVPGLADAWDETNGVLKLSNQEIETLIENAETAAVQQALLEAQQETIKELAEAQVNLARAQAGVTAAVDEYNNATELTYSGVNALNRAVSDQEAAVTAAAQAQIEATKQVEDAQKAYDLFDETSVQLYENLGHTHDEAVKLANGMSLVGEEAEKTGTSMAESTAKGVKDKASDIESAAKDAVEKGTEAANEAVQEGVDDINETVDSGLDDTSDSFDSHMDDIESSVSDSMSEAESEVSDMISNIKTELERPIKGPNIQVPHFTMTGAFDAKTNKVPEVKVDWYGQGGIFTQPTIIGTPWGWKGVGESGAEAVLPIDLLKNYIEDSVGVPTVNVYMDVDGAESPEAWAADFARELKQQMRIS